MAFKWWGVNKGQHETDVVTAGADPTKDVSVEVNLASFTSTGQDRVKVIEALTYIINNIMKGNWPP